MTPKEFIKKLDQMHTAIDVSRSKALPVAVGRIAQKHFKENFTKGGFVNGGLTPWTPSRRIARGKSLNDRRPTLMSSKKHLFSSINYTPGVGSVLIYNNVPYAAIHNNGGTISQSFVPTPKQRRFAWANYFAEAGIKKGMTKKKKAELSKNASADAKRWIGMALAKKIDRTITIPKRQFVGISKELTESVNQEIEVRIKKITERYFPGSTK